jgi:hypothetical protein
MAAILSLTTIGALLRLLLGVMLAVLIAVGMVRNPATAGSCAGR